MVCLCSTLIHIISCLYIQEEFIYILLQNIWFVLYCILFQGDVFLDFVRNVYQPFQSLANISNVQTVELNQCRVGCTVLLCVEWIQGGGRFQLTIDFILIWSCAVVCMCMCVFKRILTVLETEGCEQTWSPMQHGMDFIDIKKKNRHILF